MASTWQLGSAHLWRQHCHSRRTRLQTITNLRLVKL